MNRTSIVGLLAFAAMTTVALVGAISASAAKFTASAVGASISETTLENYAFTITGSSIQCTTNTVTGTTEGLETTTVKGVLSFSGCTAFGLPATVINNNCEFTASASGEGSMVGEKCEISVTASNIFGKCKGNAKPQTKTNAGSIANGEGDVKVTASLSGIAAEVTESTGVCPLTVGKHTNATLTGKSTVQASGATIAWDA